MLPCRRKQGCCDWEAFLISFMCSDGQIQVRNCRIKELNKILTWGDGDGDGYSQFRSTANFFHPFFVCPHFHFSFESSVIDLWELSSRAWFSARIASDAAVSSGWCPPDGDVSVLPEATVNKTNGGLLHSTLLILFHNGPISLLLSQTLSVTLDSQSHNSLREGLSWKDAFKCEM